MQLAIDVKELMDLGSTNRWWVTNWYGKEKESELDPEEVAMMPLVAPGYYLKAHQAKGVIGQLFRLARADGTFQLSVLSTIPEEFQTDTRLWLKANLPLNMNWELFNTSVFPYVPAQYYVVTDPEQVALLKGQGRNVYDSVEGLAKPVIDRTIPFPE